MGLDAVDALSDEDRSTKPTATPKPKSTAKAKVEKPKPKKHANEPPTESEKPKQRAKAKAKANTLKRPAAAPLEKKPDAAAKKRPAAADEFKVYKCRYKCGKYGFKWDGHEQMRVTCFKCSYVRIEFHVDSCCLR